MRLRIATPRDAATLLPLVRAFHEHEGIAATDSRRAEAIAPLLGDESTHGRIWLIESGGEVVGYVAICFGYSIEFGGRDAFVDELLVIETARGRGIGGWALEAVKAEAARLGARALHLEVERKNAGAKRLYEKAGFVSRERFHLMTWRPP